jgi:hypothetical protein
MNIELRNVKYFAAGSQETECFVASVYVDGVRVGIAENDGHGGCNRIDPPLLWAQLSAYAATLPREDFEIGDGKKHSIQPDADTVIGDLLAKHLAERELRKLLQKRLIYTATDAAGIYQSIVFTPAVLARLVADPASPGKLKAAKILNALPFTEALAIYTAK